MSFGRNVIETEDTQNTSDLEYLGGRLSASGEKTARCLYFQKGGCF